MASSMAGNASAKSLEASGDALETLILAHALAGDLEEHEHLIAGLRAWAAYSLGVDNRFVARLSRL